MSTITSKLKAYCILLVYIGLLQLIFYWSILPEKTTRQILIEHKELLEYPCCVSNATNEIHKNVIFLKPNTIGGSVILNVLLKFSLQQSLSVLIPEKVDDSTLVPVRGTETIDHKYNVLLLFDKFTPNVYNFAYPNTFTITILENPISIFETLFNEYKATVPFGTFKDFIANFNNSLNGSLFNPTCTRLGLKRQYHNNETKIQSFIREVESEFHLVMIYELLEPSLIFLTNAMGWPLEYATNMHLYSITPAKTYNFTPTDIIEIAKWNTADMMLYEYFIKKLENCALQYGVEQLVNEMKTLKEYNEHLTRFCLSQTQIQVQVLEQDVFSDCNEFLMTENELIQRIRNEQIQTIISEMSSDY